MGLWDRDYMRDEDRGGARRTSKPLLENPIQPRFLRAYPITIFLILAQTVGYLLWTFARSESTYDPAAWNTMNAHFVCSLSALEAGRFHTLLSHAISTPSLGVFVVRGIGAYLFVPLVENIYGLRRTASLLLVTIIATGLGAVATQWLGGRESGASAFPGATLPVVVAVFLIARNQRLPTVPITAWFAGAAYIGLDVFGSRSTLSVGAYTACTAATIGFVLAERFWLRRIMRNRYRRSVDQLLDDLRPPGQDTGVPPG